MLFVVLVVSYFNFECRTLVLIAPVPGHCSPFTSDSSVTIFWERAAHLVNHMFCLFYVFL